MSSGTLITAYLCLSYFKVSFAGYEIPGLHILSFSILEILLHFVVIFLAQNLTVKKADNMIFLS